MSPAQALHRRQTLGGQVVAPGIHADVGVEHDVRREFGQRRARGVEILGDAHVPIRGPRDACREWAHVLANGQHGELEARAWQLLQQRRVEPRDGVLLEVRRHHSDPRSR